MTGRVLQISSVVQSIDHLKDAWDDPETVLKIARLVEGNVGANREVVRTVAPCRPDD